jgi:hypothetical protein
MNDETVKYAEVSCKEDAHAALGRSTPVRAPAVV